MQKIPGSDAQSAESQATARSRTNEPDTTRDGVAISRRLWLGGAALAGVGVVCGLMTPQQARAQQKMAQADAKYQDKPQGEAKCSTCALFAPPSACNAVDGTISPDGWCSLYSAKS